MLEKEYIDLEETVVTLRHNSRKYFSSFHKGYVQAIEDLADIPAAKVAPVRHGRWVRKKALIQCDLCGFGLFPDGYFFKNGECTHSNEPSYRPNYCPHCGAKMDEEEREENA